MLNFLARYAPLRELILDEHGHSRGSILDVGCGSHGLACAFPDTPFVGTDVLFPRRVSPSMVGVRTIPGPLPFADNAFDTVLSLDTLEHVPRPERQGFVREMTRVAARKVVLACPSDEVQAYDDFLRDQIGDPVPEWLAEHYECALPSPAEIAGYVGAVAGFSARPIATSNGLLAMLIAIGDILPLSSGRAWIEFSRHRDEWTELFATATFGDSGRKAWLVERDETRTPLIGSGCSRDEVKAALRCPDCGGSYGALACDRCGRPLAVDSSAAWDLASPWRGASRVLPLETDAATILWLSPRWERQGDWMPALERYIELTSPADDCCLVLDAGLGGDEVVAAVQQACAELAGKRDFGEVLLVTGLTKRPLHTVSVDSPASIAMALSDTARTTV
jgi:hypothetical protein